MTRIVEIQDFSLWGKTSQARPLFSFDLELTARCNNNCLHCFINLPANDPGGLAQELSFAEIEHIADQAVELGALWCLLTGGEPLLRPDFTAIYLMLKRKGLLVSIFTNATLIQPAHVELFKKYPPRDIEVTVYGSTREVYERVTRKPGSFKAFVRGLDLLLNAGIPVRLKAMAIRSNLADMENIANFSRIRTKDYYRFDSLLHLRYDGNPHRNAEIQSERLTAREIVDLERADVERFGALQAGCDSWVNDNFTHIGCDHLFHCGAGNGSFSVGYDGTFKLCTALTAPETTLNLRQVSLRDAWFSHIPRIRDLRSNNPEFLNTCRKCPMINLCMHCAAHAYLETGMLDGATPYFCEVAHARAASLKE